MTVLDPQSPLSACGLQVCLRVLGGPSSHSPPLFPHFWLAFSSGKTDGSAGDRNSLPALGERGARDKPKVGEGEPTSSGWARGPAARGSPTPARLSRSAGAAQEGY